MIDKENDPTNSLVLNVLYSDEESEERQKMLISFFSYANMRESSLEDNEKDFYLRFKKDSIGYIFILVSRGHPYNKHFLREDDWCEELRNLVEYYQTVAKL